MTKPNIIIPNSFAANGDKTDFDESHITNGFPTLTPDVLRGDNLNKFIDDTYKGLNGVLELYEGCVLYDSTVTYNNTSIILYINADDEVEVYRSLINNNLNNPLTDTTAWEKVELGGVDDNRLHALKSYLDSGELLTDAEGLADVKEYAHSSFDLSKFTVVGSPTITDDGIVSGFSGSDYLQTIQCKDLTGKSWEIKGAIYYTNSITYDGVYSLNGSWFAQGGIGITQTSLVLRGLFGSGSDISAENIGTEVSYNFVDNTWYYYSLAFDITAGEYTLSLYDSNNSLLGSSTYTPPVSDKQINAIATAQATYMYIGYAMGWGVATIQDLKQFLITVDGVEVFSGNKTGIDTYTINGSTVTIPYTFSKTGSKIVDSAYRTQVSSVYNYQGYAPYYTLSDTDFTLPQGELYGMITKASDGSQCMPSDRYVDLTWGVSGSTYTAPANGWVAFSKGAGYAGGGITLSTALLAAESIAYGAADGLTVFIPVSKGEEFTLGYTATGALTYFRFIYAVGSETEAG